MTALRRDTPRGQVCAVTAKPCRTRAEQETWLVNYRQHKPPRAPRLRMYQCDICGAWHVTSMRKKP